jgi:hypothetical protein
LVKAQIEPYKFIDETQHQKYGQQLVPDGLYSARRKTLADL